MQQQQQQKQQQQQQQPFNCPLSRTTRVSRYQKGKTSLDLLEQEIVSGSGISLAICMTFMQWLDNLFSNPIDMHEVHAFL